MKLLILALYVCAANAAAYKPYQPFSFKPEVAVVPAVPAVKSVTVKPVYKPEVTVAPVVVPVAKSGSYVQDNQVPIVRFDNNYNPETQGFSYAYETGNGIAAASTGDLKRVGDVNVLGFQGSYQYTSPEGIPVQLSFVADENGYQPKSDLLPVGPPVPEAIVRSLNYIASHPQYSEPNDPKAYSNAKKF